MSVVDLDRFILVDRLADIDLRLSRVEAALRSGRVEETRQGADLVADHSADMHPDHSLPVEVVDLRQSQSKYSEPRFSEPRSMRSLATYASVSAVCDANYKLAKTIWDSMLLFGLPCVGKLGSIWLGTAFLFAVLCQALFCVIAIQAFVPGDWNTDDISPYKIWRETDGHSSTYWEQFTDRTLVSRVCVGDLSLSVADGASAAVSTIKAYQSELFGTTMERGVVLSCVCIALWFMSLIPEFQSIIAVMDALVTLPKQTSSEFFEEGANFRLTALSYVRFFCVALLMLLRLGITVIILISGSLYLARTVSIKFLLLRTGSLMCILLINELAYQAFAPAHVLHLQEKLQPLSRSRVKRIHHHRQGFLANLVYFVLMVGCTAYFWWAEVRRLNDFMTDVLHQLCSGNTDFLVQVQPATSLPLVTYTTPITQLGKDQSRNERSQQQHSAILAVREILEETRLTSAWQLWQSSFAVYARDPTSLPISYSLSMPLWNLNSADCHDIFWSSPSSRSAKLFRSLRVQTGINGSTCGDFYMKCAVFNQVLLRHSCPKTCGCGNEHSGLWVDGPAYGCKRDICKHTMSSPYFSIQPCVDPSPLVLWMDWPGWRRFVASVDASKILRYGLNVTELNVSGCNFDLKHWDLCTPTISVGSAAPFCPVACGCTSINFRNGLGKDVCPKSCGNSSGTP